MGDCDEQLRTAAQCGKDEYFYYLWGKRKLLLFYNLHHSRGGERTKDYSWIIPLLMWTRHSHYKPGQMTHHVNPLVNVLISWLEVSDLMRSNQKCSRTRKELAWKYLWGIHAGSWVSSLCQHWACSQAGWWRQVYALWSRASEMIPAMASKWANMKTLGTVVTARSVLRHKVHLKNWLFFFSLLKWYTKGNIQEWENRKREWTIVDTNYNN